MEPLNKGIIIIIRDSIFEIANEIKEYSNDLYNKLMAIKDDLDNSFFKIDDKFVWPMTKKDFIKEFDLNKITVEQHIRNLKLKERGEYWVEGRGRRGPAAISYISIFGGVKILEKIGSEKGKRYLRRYHRINIPTKAERKYLDIIQYAIQQFDIPIRKKLVKINNDKYEVDLYLEKSKLAIECDEQGHAYKNPFKESSREEAIAKELGCRFLRFNPGELDFNIGEVVNVALCHILDKEINGEDPLEYYNNLKGKHKRKSVWEHKLKGTTKRKTVLPEIDLAEFD